LIFLVTARPNSKVPTGLKKSASNPKQRWVRWLGLLLLIGIGLCPPWLVSHVFDDHEETASVGYHAVWNPPVGELEAPENAIESQYRVDLVRLGIQCGVVLVLINLGNHLLRDRNSQGG
jgi:hypothetical protein